MKKHIVIITLILCASGLFSLFTLNRAKAAPEQKNTVTEKVYVLSDYKGQIALFSKENEKPIQIFQIYTESLPEKDAEKIRNGIIIKENELTKILEDYIS